MFSLRRKKQHNFAKFMVCIITSFCLVLWQQFYAESANNTILKVQSKIAFITNITSKPEESLNNCITNMTFYFNTVEENKKLFRENAKLQNLYRQSLKFVDENQELRYLMNMAQYVKQETLVANVMLDSANLYAHSVIINLGQEQGLKSGFAVVNSEGLIGKVLEVDKHNARILLIHDFNSTIPVRVLGSGVQGLVKGKNNSEELVLVTKEAKADVKPGDSLVTSSVQGLFDDGIPLGIVSNVEKEKISVIPYANLNRVHKVLIIKRETN